jgi:predicted DNA-binding WGR domain protein
MGLLGSKAALPDQAALFVRAENAKEKTFWCCHVVGSTLTVNHGDIGAVGKTDVINFPSPEEALDKKNSYLKRRLEEGYKIAGDQTEPVVTIPEDAWEDPASEPVESPAPTPRKRSAAGTPGSKRQKTGASAKASPKRTPNKATTPKATPKKAATPKRATSTKKTATPKASELRRSPRLAALDND